MKVGIVCPYSFARPGGVQNHVLGLAGWLKEHGHKVSIIAPGRATPALLAETGLLPGEFVSAGRAVPVNFNGSVARINFGIGPALAVKHWLDNGQFDVVHLHEPVTPSICLLALYFTDRPVTATFHTATPAVGAVELANRILPRVVSRIDSSIAVSSEAAAVAQHHRGVAPVVIGNGIHVDDYPICGTQGRWRGGEHPRLTFLGRYDEPRKGFEVLTAALPLVRAHYPDLDVVVIGNGSSRSVEGVRFLGGLDDQARNEWLGRSDIYIAPQTGRESFGIVLLEALACGAPVVASDLRAFVEVLTDDDGPVGWLFRAGNSASASRAILRSLAEPRDLRLSRGRALAERYDWSVIGPQVLAMYVLAQQNSAWLRDKDTDERRPPGATL
ncbi:phosphatidylinositol alpha-mannosyltransferase [Propionibacterium cyclohexanicum]|uniref:Phosphatidylinositol alpha-mannosyltransferase n=1 Tax=Propionibacterium cyclohexanicum TaxID=64702 RepID=A0A1H9QPL0_9ACTN|nr:glycosyltransferase family 4 protein [Propionibacterium cyclohexanicum]SER61769.1 phosphatidylinositol alpha-mannosyltransferase [Propionibacterium cyclohexanicum]